MPERTLPTRWPRLGRSRSRLVVGLEGLVAAMMLMYSGGVALTRFSDTLLNDPSVRVPFLTSVRSMLPLLFLAIAHEAAGKGTRTALLARLLALCILAAQLAVAGLLTIVTGETRVRFLGLGALLAWASPTVLLMVTQHRALWLLVFVGWPIFASSHVVLASMGLFVRSMMWIDPGDDDALEFKLLLNTTSNCVFQSFELLACIWAQERLPRHLPRERPRHVSVRNGASRSMLVMLALTGVAVAFIYQNFLPQIVSPSESATMTILPGSGRHLLSRWRLVLSECPTDGATLWGVLAAFTIGALLVASRVARMRSESRLSKLDGSLEVRRFAGGRLCYAASSDHAKC
jgi:hypothetical protein